MTTLRRAIIIAATLAIGGCSQAEPDQGEGARNAVADTSSPTAGPSVALTAAPGVAFTYRYNFGLRSDRIAGVQEQHAQACEKLGIDRCRIAGMAYHVESDGGVTGSLLFKLQPAIARAFAGAGIKTVEAASGALVDAEIGGEDLGSDIDTAKRAADSIRADLDRIAREKAAARSAAERTSHLAAEERLRLRLRDAEDQQQAGRALLAVTPVTFNYGSGPRSRIAWALDDVGDNFEGSLAAIITILSVLLPWLVLIGITVIVTRYVRRRWFREVD